MKTKEILIVILLGIILLLVPNVVKAATSPVEVKTITVVNSKTEPYQTGEKVTIVAEYTDTITGEGEITIKFGSKGQNNRIKGTASGNKITYEYIIKDKDSGKLSLEYCENSYLKDKEGNNLQNKNISLEGKEITVNPITWTDTTNCKISIEGHATKYRKLKITGLKEIEGHEYYVFITNSKEEPTLTVDKNGWVSNSDFFLVDISIEKYLEKSGDIYFWICEEQENYDTGKREQKFIFSKKVERPAQNKLGLRIGLGLNVEETSVLLYEPHSDEIKRNVKVKIGQVTDNTVLKAIKNGDSSKLLSYAKTDKGIYTKTMPVGKSESIMKELNLANKAYYYIYSVLDDENGIYYPVEDVSFVQASVVEIEGVVHKSLLTDINIELKQDDSNKTEPEQKEPVSKPAVQNTSTKVEPKDDTVAKGRLPQTGEAYMILFSIIILSFGAIIFVYQYNKYKGI